MSEMNTKPKIVQNKELKEIETIKFQRIEEYEKALKGDKPRIKELTWTKYHHVPEKLKPMSHGFKDIYDTKKFEKIDVPFLPKGPYGEDKIPQVLKLDQVLRRDNTKIFKI